jgi:2-isopropylmalate synthase
VKDKNADIPVDIALVDCPLADQGRLSEFINLATMEGLSIAKICDSRGIFYPNQVEHFFNDLKKNIIEKVTLGIHFHNDLGLAMWNTLQVLKQGIRITASSWLGLGERAGLVPTEQILFLLFHEQHLLFERLGIENPEKLFTQNIETKGIVTIAKHISKELDIPIKPIDPIIGSGLISISTGLPFTNPKQFQPFDPKEILGLEQEVIVTHMASKKVVSHVANKMGYEFDDFELEKILTIIKSKPYDSKHPTFGRNELTEIFCSIKQNDFK